MWNDIKTLKHLKLVKTGTYEKPQGWGKEVLQNEFHQTRNDAMDIKRY